MKLFLSKPYLAMITLLFSSLILATEEAPNYEDISSSIKERCELDSDTNVIIISSSMSKQDIRSALIKVSQIRTRSSKLYERRRAGDGRYYGGRGGNKMSFQINDDNELIFFVNGNGSMTPYHNAIGGSCEVDLGGYIRVDYDQENDLIDRIIINSKSVQICGTIEELRSIGQLLLRAFGLNEREAESPITLMDTPTRSGCYSTISNDENLRLEAE